VKVQPQPILVAIKLVHTAVWLLFVGCIAAIPVAGALGRFHAAVVLSGLVFIECGVLALNGGRCPLTNLAGCYTSDRVENFDIYLPLLLARHNKATFGTLFAAGELFVFARWLVLPR
jgi:hypothetical protein